MSRIRILAEEVSNRIAAGEVVERPASVVKELVENSLDAGASHVSIQIRRGGRSLIRVSDDGFGMDSEDVLLCLEAHATSKISSAADIEKIDSFGFRGEALPSIASVCHLELRSRVAENPAGTEVLVSGGVIRNVAETGCAPGTSVTVKNLFYNLPARRKFLRSVRTEEFHIQEIVLLLALANPRAGFQLTFDDRPIIAVQAGNDLATRATMIFGKDSMRSMIPVSAENDELKVGGFVARPGLTRTSRREQRVFVNGRPIDARTIYNAVRDAYHTMVMKGRYPPVLLFVDVLPELVDVNVHPAKREVRFRHDRQVGEFVGIAIRQALRQIVTDSPPIPEPLRQPQMSERETTMPATLLNVNAGIPGRRREPMSFATGASVDEPSPSAFSATDADSEVAPAFAPRSPAAGPNSDRGRGTSISAAGRDAIRAMRVIGCLSDLYLLAEGPDGLVLIDQHAAHERVLFEKILHAARSRDGNRQGLLIPVTMEFSNADAAVLRKHHDRLNRLGFEIDDFGGSTFVINAVPAHFPQTNLTGMLHDIIDTITDSPLGARRVDDDAIALAACKAAVKAHDHLSASEITQLLQQLVDTELPYTCPHGRPTMINIAFGELERRFGRRA